MRITCHELGARQDSAVIFWEETFEVGGKTVQKKVFKTVTKGSSFDVEDAVGHSVISKYPEYLKVEFYGAIAPAPSAPDAEAKSVQAPRQAMIKEERIK